MKSLRQAWFRFVDRELDRAVVLPDRETTKSGEWNAWVGETGERLAGKALWRRGAKVLYRNFRPGNGGEIDIVSRDGEVLVFNEVKTRTSEKYGRPIDAVNRGKQRLVIRGANAWLRELNQPSVLVRFDVIEVILRDGEPPEVNVVEDSFVAPQAGLGM